MTKPNRKLQYFGLIAVILLCLSLAVCHGCYKEYFYEDEVLSYTLSNSRSGAYFNLKPGNTYNGADLYATTYVEPGHAFDFAQTIENQGMDTHPPIYALLLHVFSSLSPGHFSKWSGIVLNLICFAIVLVLFYKTILEIFPGREYFALFSCLVFGMNPGVIELVVFIRMYMVMMIFTMLCMLWHIRAIDHKPSVKMYVLLSLITVCGILTQYFYLVFAFYAAAVLCLWWLFHKQFREFVGYVLSMIVSFGLVLLIWSRIIWQLFAEETAEDAYSQAMTPRLVVSKILTMIRQANADLLDDRLKWIALIVLAFAVYLLIKDRQKLKRSVCVNHTLMLMILVNALFFLTISAITPYLNLRYASPAIPFIILFVVLTLEQVAGAALKSPVVGYVIIALFLLWPEYTKLKEGLFDVNRQIVSDVSTEHAGELCLFGASIPPEENVFELRKFDSIFIYDGGNAEDASDEIKDADRLVLYVPKDTDPEEYAADIRRINPKLTETERLYVAYYSTCYLLSE